jgi:signal transduction histidine kinase
MKACSYKHLIGGLEFIHHELEAARNELAEAERQAGAAQERQRLAHEIHDTLAQGFTSILMHVETASSILHEDGGAVQQHLDQVCRTARENLVESRRLMWALQPEGLDRASLPEVLAHFTQKWSEENVVKASTTITGSPRTLRPEIEVTVLRAAQEALANVRKHAKASQVFAYLLQMTTRWYAQVFRLCLLTSLTLKFSVRPLMERKRFQ